MKIDLNSLEIAALDGSFKLSSTHAQFEKGRSTWKSTVEETTVAYYLNNKNIIFLDILESLQDSTFKFVGSATFHDLWLSNSALNHAVMTNLCKTDRIFSPLPIGVEDEALNAAAVEKCSEDMQSTTLSVSLIHEYMSKLLVVAANSHARSKASISQLHNIVANLSSSVASSAEGKERDRVRAIMTEFEAVVDALRLEVTGKVKGMGASVDTLRSQWVQVGSTIDALNSSLTSIVTSSMHPIELALEDHRTHVTQQQSMFNSTVSALEQHVRTVQEQRIQQLNESIEGLEAGQASVQDKLRYKFSFVNTSMLALAGDISTMRDALNTSISTINVQLRSAIQEEKVAKEAAAIAMAGLVSELQLNISGLHEHSAALNESLGTLTLTVADQRSTMDTLSQQVGDQHIALQLALNSSVNSLQGQVMGEFGHTRRELTAAVVSLNESIGAVKEIFDISIAQLESSLEENVSAARNASMSYADARHAIVLDLVALNANTCSDRHQLLEETVANVSAQIKWELANVTQTHWEATAASIAELTTNTSHVVARSNSILARAIGEVNSSMLAITDTLQQSVGVLREEALVNLTAAIDAVSAAAADQVHSVQVKLEAEQAAAQLATKDAIFLHSEETKVALVELSTQVNASSVEWSSSLEMHKEDTAHNLQMLNTTIAQGLRLTQSIMAEQHSNLSTRLENVQLHLTAAQNESARSLRQELVAAAAQLNTSFSLEVAALNETMLEKISALAASSEDRLTSSTDKLRYTFAAMNNSLSAQRAEDLATLQASQASAQASHEALELRLSNTSQGFREQLTELRNHTDGAMKSLADSLQVSISSVEQQLLDVHRNSSELTQQQFLATHQRIDRLNVSLLANLSVLALSVEEGQRALRASVDETHSKAVAADEAIRRSVEKALQEQTLALRTETAVLLNATTVSANASLNAVVGNLNATLVAWIQGVEAQGVGNFSVLSAALQQVGSALNSSKGALTEHINKVGSDLSASIQSHSTSTNTKFAEHHRDIAGLSDSLKIVTGNLSDQISAQSTKLVADVEAVRTALITANTSGTRRMDASEAALNSLASSAEGRLATLSSDLAKHVAASNATATAAAARVQQLHDSLSAEVNQALHSLNASLSRTVQSSAEKAGAALEASAHTLTARIDEVERHLLREQKQLGVNLSASISALSSEFLKEQESSKARHALVQSEFSFAKEDQEKVNNLTNAKVTSISASVADLSAGLSRQATVLTASLSNFTGQQKESQDALLAAVNERVRKAEVQQQLGAVVMEAVRNDTQRLSQSVSTASARVVAAEIDAVALRADVRHLQEQGKQYSSYYSNFTAAVLPSLHSQLGALQQESSQASASYQKVVSEVQSLKDETREKLGDISSKHSTAGIAVQAKLTSLSESAAAHEEAIAVLQSRYIDTAVQSNSTSSQVRALDTATTATNLRLDAIAAQLNDVADTQRRVDGADAKITALADTVKTLEKSSAAEARLLREVADKQTGQIAALEELVRRQGVDLRLLQEENRRLLRETSTTASVDEMRKLLFELQGQMLTHSSKVLDLLLQPRSAVLVHNPVPCDKNSPAAPCVEPEAVFSEETSQ